MARFGALTVETQSASEATRTWNASAPLWYLRVGGEAMPEVERQTIVAHGRLTMREMRLHAARERRHGLQIMTFEQLAVRLAGGLARPVDDDALREAIKAVLPETALGELDGIKALPGMVGAAADTLRKAWRAAVDLQARAAEHPRVHSIASLEAAVVDALPPAMMRPADLVTAGLVRLDHAAVLFGPINIIGITELSPVWRPLLHAIAGCVPVRWIAGPRPVPAWLDGDAIEIVREEAQSPELSAVSAATAYHEAVEAMRWARQLLASGRTEPADIAIASATPTDYDDHLLALRADASLDLHFVHGVKVTASREGQAAAALADVLLRGLSQTRMRRLERAQVIYLQQKMSGNPSAANTVVKTLSHMYRLGAGWRMVPEGCNPCRSVARYPERKRERFLTDAEFTRLGRVLEEAVTQGSASPTTVAAIRLLMLTGCRKNEILTLRWKDVDLDAGELNLWA